jgi:adenine-specific DNA-methyltransferase
MSRRYYARESDARAAPYSVPYDGREVYLHWANKDQYYIKSSEYLSNYTFELNEAIRQEVDRQKTLKGKGQSFDFGDLNSELPLKVHFRLIDASEGEHGNIKTASDQKRFFILHAATPIKVEQGELVIQFEYRSDKEKSGQDNKWQETRLQQAEVTVLDLLKNVPDAQEFLKGLALPAPTDSKDKRTLLGKHMQKYASKNSMDYFIHKDLGGFLRRELDFYIKNEIMHLDDLENADVPKVEQYLTKVKVLRRIASQLIVFLAQLEEFQKRLWLKKKFVVETNYCITVDRIPEYFYPEIVESVEQREEWVRLFSIDEIKQDITTVGYTVLLTTNFLKENSYLVLDTKYFTSEFVERLIQEFDGFSDMFSGTIIHSENFNALNLLEGYYRNGVKLILTDPPYNTKTDVFPYKDSYKHSSWLTMMSNRMEKAKDLLRGDGIYFHHIDENEHQNASLLLTEVFGASNRVVDIVWKNSSKNGESFISMQHEYIVGAVKNAGINKGVWLERKEGLEEIYKAFEGFRRRHGTDWKAIHQAALDFYNSFPDSNPIKDSSTTHGWMKRVFISQTIFLSLQMATTMIWSIQLQNDFVKNQLVVGVSLKKPCSIK